MSHQATTWAYAQAIDDCGAKFVLVTLAGFADEEWSCFPGQETLAKLTGQSVRSVRRHMGVLTECGFITRKRRFLADGHRTSDRYYLQRPPANLTTGQSDHRPNMSRPPAKLAGYPLEEPSDQLPAPTVLPAKAGAAPAKPTLTQRSKAITDAYALTEPMCRWPAVNGVVLKALKIGRWADDELRAALLRLAAEGRSVTVETLRIELDGLPAANARASPKPSTTDQRVMGALELADQYRKGDNRGQTADRRAIGTGSSV